MPTTSWEDSSEIKRSLCNRDGSVADQLTYLLVQFLIESVQLSFEASLNLVSCLLDSTVAVISVQWPFIITYARMTRKRIVYQESFSITQPTFRQIETKIIQPRSLSLSSRPNLLLLHVFGNLNSIK